MQAKLVYVIKYVADMDRAVAFHRDKLGLAVKFATPFWTEFQTGETTLALHPETKDHKAGECQVGYRADDLAAAYAARDALGLTFTCPPTPQHGVTIARFLDSEDAECSISG